MTNEYSAEYSEIVGEYSNIYFRIIPSPNSENLNAACKSAWAVSVDTELSAGLTCRMMRMQLSLGLPYSSVTRWAVYIDSLPSSFRAVWKDYLVELVRQHQSVVRPWPQKRPKREIKPRPRQRPREGLAPPPPPCLLRRKRALIV